MSGDQNTICFTPGDAYGQEREPGAPASWPFTVHCSLITVRTWIHA